jgi:AbrB family looped-hinge helix DNA binding protein
MEKSAMIPAIHATVRVDQGGRIVIPAALRRRMKLRTGSKLVLTSEGDQATLMPLEASIRHAQELVARYIKPGTLLSQELMAERRREAARE